MNNKIKKTIVPLPDSCDLNNPVLLKFLKMIFKEHPEDEISIISTGDDCPECGSDIYGRHRNDCIKCE